MTRSKKRARQNSYASDYRYSPPRNGGYGYSSRNDGYRQARSKHDYSDSQVHDTADTPWAYNPTANVNATNRAKASPPGIPPANSRPGQPYPTKPPVAQPVVSVQAIVLPQPVVPTRPVVPAQPVVSARPVVPTQPNPLPPAKSVQPRQQVKPVQQPVQQPVQPVNPVETVPKLAQAKPQTSSAQPQVSGQASTKPRDDIPAMREIEQIAKYLIRLEKRMGILIAEAQKSKQSQQVAGQAEDISGSSATTANRSDDPRVTSREALKATIVEEVRQEMKKEVREMVDKEIAEVLAKEVIPRMSLMKAAVSKSVKAEMAMLYPKDRYVFGEDSITHLNCNTRAG